MERYYHLGTETVQTLNDFISKFVSSPIRLKYAFLGDTKLKKLIQIERVDDKTLFLHKEQVRVLINENLWINMADDELLEILVKEEFNKLILDGSTGKIKIGKLSFTSSESIIERYSYEEVKRAKDMEKLILQQVNDKEGVELVDISQ